MSLPFLFYIQDLNTVVLEMICAFLFWTVLMLVLKGRVRQIVSIGASVPAVFAIIYMTILSRSASEMSVAELTPFITFVNAHEEVELYRTMLMNVCLFMPLGLSLPFALSNKFRHCVLITVMGAMLLSISIEAIQFAFRLGRCETDDVIMNVLGALLGALSLPIVQKVLKFKSRHVHRHIGRSR